MPINKNANYGDICLEPAANGEDDSADDSERIYSMTYVNVM